jgi:hypothetical protein
LGKLNVILIKGGVVMSNIRSSFNNIKGHRVETARETIKFEDRHYLREPHGIQEGIRKDKKLKMNHKTFE